MTGINGFSKEGGAIGRKSEEKSLGHLSRSETSGASGLGGACP